MREWISIDDRFPSSGDSVLTIGLVDDGDFSHPIVATVYPDGKIMSSYCFSGSRSIYFAVETFPTHWMPLPAPPES